MSGDEDKGFLSRWSQRKHEAKLPEPKPDEPVAEASVQPVADSAPEPEFDLSSLPRLEEMTGTTDITAFLRKGVPEQLRNAALRQSWALDPAIRNYVNPALEYAYDWNTPGGVPGSSELGAGMDVAQMVLQIMGTGESEAESVSAVDPDTERSEPAEGPESEVAQEPAPDLPSQSVRPSSEEGISVAQKPGNERISKPESDHAASQQQVRRHGSAKPLV
jgi:Protein of unknown function (DUF3306)